MPNKSTKQYTAEFKESAVKLAVEFDQTITDTARDLDVNISTLHAWIRRIISQNNQSEKLKVNDE